MLDRGDGDGWNVWARIRLAIEALQAPSRWINLTLGTRGRESVQGENPSFADMRDDGIVELVVLLMSAAKVWKHK